MPDVSTPNPALFTADFNWSGVVIFSSCWTVTSPAESDTETSSTPGTAFSAFVPLPVRPPQVMIVLVAVFMGFISL